MLSMLEPPPTAEELALKDEVTQILISQGILAKLKAELRAAVFDVMHERKGFQKPICAPKLSDFPKDTRTIALSLIVECLRFFQWEHTLRVLLTETNTENEQQDSDWLAKKLRLSTTNPILFQLIECQVAGGNERAVDTEPLPATEHSHFDDEQEWWSTKASASAVNALGTEAEAVLQSPLKLSSNTESIVAKDEERKSRAENEASMVGSEAELENTNLADNRDERSHTQSISTMERPTKVLKYVHDDAEGSDIALENNHETGENDDDTMLLVVPPPAPAKLPSLPPLVGNAFARDAKDDFKAEEEAERLRRLEAVLQAMESEDETGTLQQLKASLILESQEQDDREEADESDDMVRDTETGKNGNEEKDDEGYETSDFEEEEEIASDISEEMESMPDLSDREDDSEYDRPVMSVLAVEPPRVLQLDTRVDSEAALNSYDYVESVEKER